MTFPYLVTAKADNNGGEYIIAGFAHGNRATCAARALSFEMNGCVTVINSRNNVELFRYRDGVLVDTLIG